MTSDLVFGLVTTLIGVAALGVRFAGARVGWTNDPYADVLRQGWFGPIFFGVVPLLAGLAFLGAWSQGDRHAPYVVQRADVAAER